MNAQPLSPTLNGVEHHQPSAKARSRDCVVAHPGVQHAPLLALALHDIGRLDTLATRFLLGGDPGPPWSWLLGRQRIAARLQRRLAPFLDDHFITRHSTISATAARALTQMPRSRTLGRRIEHHSLAGFTRHTERSLSTDARYLIVPPGCALPFFSSARLARRGIVRVLDVAHPAPRVVKELIWDDSRRFGYRPEAYDDWHLLDDRTTVQAEREAQLADVILCASEFTASSLRATGAPGERIHVVPYGYPSQPDPAAATPSDPSVEPERSEDLRLVFVGGLSERKGVSLLLQAMRELAVIKPRAHLDLVGSVAAPLDLEPPANVSVRRGLSAAAVQRCIRKAHYLVLPSMCEGFGRVLVEALAAGTGVITTERTAGPDLRRSFPHAPIEICKVGERTQLADLFSRLAESVASTGIDRSAARAAGATFTPKRYGHAVAAALGAGRRADGPSDELPARNLGTP